MTDSEFIKQLNSGKLSGGFLFFGEEELVKSRYIDTFAKKICGEVSSAVILDGGEITPDSLYEAVCTSSMWDDTTFTVVKNAKVGAWKDDVLESYISVFREAKGNPDSTFVISVAGEDADFGNIEKNKPTTLYKKLTEHLTPVEFAKKGGAQLRKWIERHFLTQGLTPEYNTAEVLMAYSGNDMFTLTGECEKLIAYAKYHKMATVPAEIVYEVCSPDMSEEAFALANATLSGDKQKALEALYGAKLRREEPVAVLASISRTIADMCAVAVLASDGMTVYDIAKRLKLHEYKTKLYLQAVGKNVEKAKKSLLRCLEADMQIKSSGLGYIAIERLICGEGEHAEM